jgi:GTP pyrophosphokinase
MTEIYFNRNRERIRAWLHGKEYFKAVEALEYASKFHTGRRKDGSHEFLHQIAIGHYTRTLPNLRDQETTMIAALLHDVIEDYDVPPEIIESKFGKDAAEAVMLLTKEYRGVKKSTEDYYHSMSSNFIASIVKGADRIHNHQTCSGVFTLKKQEKYILETETYLLPMLKKARNLFPDQELAYENIKYSLKGQIELIRIAIEARKITENIQSKDSLFCKPTSN